MEQSKLLTEETIKWIYAQTIVNLAAFQTMQGVFLAYVQLTNPDNEKVQAAVLIALQQELAKKARLALEESPLADQLAEEEIQKLLEELKIR